MVIKGRKEKVYIKLGYIEKPRLRKPEHKTCEIFVAKKLEIVNELRKGNLCPLNRRSELVSKFRNINRFSLKIRH